MIMKKYRLEIMSDYGERYNMTVDAKNYAEAESKVMLLPGWYIKSYSIVGVTA